MDSRRTLAALGALVILVAAGLVLVTLRGDGRASAVREEPAAEAARGAAHDVVPALEPLPAVARESLELVPRGGTDVPAEPSAAPAVSDSGDALVVEVVERDTGAPVVDAEVRYRELDASTGRRTGSRAFLRPRRDSPVARTDARGLARLELPRALPVELTAEAPGLVGQETVPAGVEGERRARVECLPDWSLAVEVVDAGGSPAAGLDVHCTRSYGGGSSSDGQRTDARGRCRFERVGYELERAPGTTVRVSVDLLLPATVSASVERRPADDAPVRLVLPPLGSVRATVIGPDGAPAPDGTPVELRIVREGVEPAFGVVQEELTSDGEAAFEHVGLGLELELSAGTPFDAERATLQLPGPRAAGERVDAILAMALDATVLVFRAVDASGAPIAGRLDLRTESRSRDSTRSTGTSAEAGPDGCFEVVVTPWVRGEARELVVRSKSRGLLAAVDLARDFPIARVEMGDLVLADAPLVAEGRVVDGDGRPVADALVRAKAPFGRAEPGEEPHFFQVSGAESRTDEGGAFRIAGRIEAPRVQVELDHPELLAGPREVAVGARGIELVARGTGSLAGAVLLDPGFSSRDLSLAVRRDGEEHSSSAVRRAPAVGAGDFRFDRLLPGRYTLSVFAAGEPLAEIGGIEVVAGEVALDPRVQALDLRGRLYAFELVLVPPEPVTELRATVQHGPSEGGEGAAEADGADREGRLRTTPFRGERTRLVAPYARVEAIVRATGFREERIAELLPRTEVRLRHGWPVVLALSPALDLPGRGARLGAFLGEESAFGSSAPFGASREAHCTAPAVGRVRVRLTYERSDAASTTRTPLALDRELWIDVRDVPDEQRFELDLTNDELVEALSPR